MNDTRPKITYKKWWHRFIPKYRRNIKIMDKMFSHNWYHGGKEEMDKALTELVIYGKTEIAGKTFYWDDMKRHLDIIN